MLQLFMSCENYSSDEELANQGEDFYVYKCREEKTGADKFDHLQRSLAHQPNHLKFLKRQKQTKIATQSRLNSSEYPEK